jgi:hypothetical protein
VAQRQIGDRQFEPQILLFQFRQPKGEAVAPWIFGLGREVKTIHPEVAGDQ